MDGGIYDNQGISSILLVNKRDANAFDLLLISDTDQSGDEIYRDAGPLNNGFLTLRNALRIIVITFLASILSVGALLWSLWTDRWVSVIRTGFGQIVPLLTMIVIVISIAYVWRRWREVRRGLDQLDQRLADVLLRDLSQLYLRELGAFARNRLLSVLKMATDIFLKRVRALCRTEAQELQTRTNSKRDPEADSGDTDAENHGNPFVVETRIVKLTGLGKLAPFEPVVKWLTPTAEMLNVAEVAKEVGTQLWFNMSRPGGAERIMNALRLSGEMTCCASLLKYLLQYRQETGGTPENPRFNAELRQLYNTARKYWEGDLTNRAKAFR
jgi:hypothetical protein